MADGRAERVAVAGGIAVAWVIIAAWAAAAWVLLDAPVETATASRLALAARCLIPVGLCLMVAVGMVAAHRHLIAGIGGGRVEGDLALDLKLRFLTNTAEQAILAVIAYPAFAVTAPEAALRLLPAAAALFLAARAAFYLGYRTGRAVNRSVGFACTFYPTGLMLLASAAFALS